MSQWGQDPARVQAVRSKRQTDVDRWKSLDSHNPGWINRAIILAKLIPSGSRILELGAGRAFLRDHLPPGCVYQPSDIIAHEPDFLVIDLNKADALPANFDIVVALGVLEYVYDVPRALKLIRAAAPKVVLSYSCHVPGEDPAHRLNQGWLSDMTEREFETALADTGYVIKRRLDSGSTPVVKQTIYVCSGK